MDASDENASSRTLGPRISHLSSQVSVSTKKNSQRTSIEKTLRSVEPSDTRLHSKTSWWSLPRLATINILNVFASSRKKVKPSDAWQQSQRKPSGPFVVTQVDRKAQRQRGRYVRSVITRAHHERRKLCSNVFENFLPFSWIRFFLTLGTYAMLCSDVPRTDVGINDLSSHGIHEMNHFSLYGPWYYTVFTSYFNGTGTAPLWNYKYSATSISWRAFATFLNVSEYPDCYLYRSACAQAPGDRINGSIAFPMIDGVVEAVKHYKRNVANHTSSRPRQPSEVVLRTQTRFYDRFHHYILPQLFVFPVWRTHQALHYPHEMLFSMATGDTKTRGGLQLEVHGKAICFHKSGVRPFFCDDIWINYRRSCRAIDTFPQVGVIWVDTFRRLMQLQLKFPGKRVDLTLLSSHEDVQHNIGGLSYMSRRKVDVATVMRVRDCVANGDTQVCSTVYIDDSRYENALFATSATEWYTIVVTLRVFAQIYFYLRIAMLFYGCYCARADEDIYKKRSVGAKLCAAWHLFVRIPSPSLVYGSPIPVVCYATAHLLDAPLTYEIIAQHFSKPMGQYKFEFWTFFRFAATQMRNVWVLALIVQIGLYIFMVNRSWSAVKGVIGLPEFSLACIACLTILTQWRMLVFRDSRILALYELPRRAKQQSLQNKFVTDHHGTGSMLMEGIILDFKYFMCLLVALVLLMGFGHLVLETCGYYDSKHHTKRALFMTRSAVPYSAGALWSAIAVSISWTNDVISDKLADANKGILRRAATTLHLIRRRRNLVVRPTETKGSIHVPTVTSMRHRVSLVNWPTGRVKKTKFLLHQMEHIHERRPEVDTISVVLNLVNMTDPWVYFSLRYLGHENIYYFEYEPTKRVFMLPESVVYNYHNIDLPWEEMTFLQAIKSSQLTWSNLIQCG